MEGKLREELENGRKNQVEGDEGEEVRKSNRLCFYEVSLSEDLDLKD